MDVLLFLLLTLIFVSIYLGHKKPALILFSGTIVLYIYWFSYHATDALNINL